MIAGNAVIKNADIIFKLKMDANLVVFGFHCKSILNNRDMVDIFFISGNSFHLR